MYRVSKRMEIAGAHQLHLDYESKCTNLHGHNWVITVYCEAKTLDHNGMIIDFKKIKEMVSDKLDHQYINNVLGPVFNPTAENMALWIHNTVDCMFIESDARDARCYKVTVQESEGNIAEWEDV